MRSTLATILLLAMFAVWANEAEQAQGDVESDSARNTEDADSLTFDDLFRRVAIRHTELSPNGEFIAFFRDYTLVVGKPGVGYYDLRKFPSRLSIEKLVWIGRNAVWVKSWDPERDVHFGSAIRFSDLGAEGYGVDEISDHYDPGYISDPMSGDDVHVVLARPKVADDTLVANLYTINVFQDIDPQLKRANRVDTGSEDFFYYQRNAAGEYILGIRITEGVPAIWRKLPDSDKWEPIWTADTESTFIPWQMSDDAKTLWVLSDAETDRVAAVEFNLETREFGNILYQHDRVDVDGILVSTDGHTPIGVVYTEQGLLRYHFFSPERQAEFERLQAHFSSQGIILIGYSEGSNVRLVFASSAAEPGRIHVCDLTSDQCELVESVAPWLEGKLLSETIALDIPSTEGIVVEAFLTLPPESNGSIPLIAMPHGGPIGVSDDRYFSPEVQWLAHNGYAVLQVNYRGSGGYGERFEKAGLRQWGRGIEDDIEAAVRKVLVEYPRVDGERVGIFGGSYGGYSAIMSVIRNPELFKCAASFAGVMDLTLLFTQSATSRNEYLRKALIDFVGDPDIDYEEQTEHSPVYRYKDIQRPVLLGHGMEDSIVDVEHSWRLRKLMGFAGAKPEFVLLEGVGHGFNYVKEAQSFYDPLLKFLDKHLKPDLQEPVPVSKDAAIDAS